MDIFTKKYAELIAKLSKTTKKHLVKEQADDQVEQSFNAHGYKYDDVLTGYYKDYTKDGLTIRVCANTDDVEEDTGAFVILQQLPEDEKNIRFWVFDGGEYRDGGCYASDETLFRGGNDLPADDENIAPWLTLRCAADFIDEFMTNKLDFDKIKECTEHTVGMSDADLLEAIKTVCTNASFKDIMTDVFNDLADISGDIEW